MGKELSFPLTRTRKIHELRENWTGYEKEYQTGQSCVGNDDGVELEINWKLVRMIPGAITTFGWLPQGQYGSLRHGGFCILCFSGIPFATELKGVLASSDVQLECLLPKIMISTVILCQVASFTRFQRFCFVVTILPLPLMSHKGRSHAVDVEL